MNEINIIGKHLGRDYGIFDFLRDADQAGPDAVVVLDCSGGDGATGLCIADEIRRRGLSVRARNAASAAVPILTAGKHRLLAADGRVFLHRSWTVVAGDTRQMIETAEAMAKRDNAYAETIADHTGKSPAVIMGMMQAETALNAKQALDAGMIDSIGPAAGLQPPGPNESKRMERLDRLREYMARHARNSQHTTPEPSPDLARELAHRKVAAQTMARDSWPQMPPHRWLCRFRPLEYLSLIDGIVAEVSRTTREIIYWPASWLDDFGNEHFQPPKRGNLK